MAEQEREYNHGAGQEAAVQAGKEENQKQGLTQEQLKEETKQTAQ